MDLLKAHIKIRYLGLGLNNREDDIVTYQEEKLQGYRIVEMEGQSLIFLVNSVNVPVNLRIHLRHPS